MPFEAPSPLPPDWQLRLALPRAWNRGGSPKSLRASWSTVLAVAHQLKPPERQLGLVETRKRPQTLLNQWTKMRRVVRLIRLQKPLRLQHQPQGEASNFGPGDWHCC